MIPVRLAGATREQLARLAQCGRWYMGLAMCYDIQKGTVDLGPVEREAIRIHGIEVVADQFVPDGWVIGWEPGDSWRNVAFDTPRMSDLP